MLRGGYVWLGPTVVGVTMDTHMNLDVPSDMRGGPLEAWDLHPLRRTDLLSGTRDCRPLEAKLSITLTAPSNAKEVNRVD